MRPFRILVRFSTCICLTSLLGLLAGNAEASPVHYEWSGTIVPTGASDPWLIGTSGLPFTLQARLQGNAPDLADVDLKVGLFAVDDARLIVAGREISYVGDGILDFTDDSLTNFDLLTFNGTFELNGVLTSVPSAVALPIETIQFVDPSEMPPVFGSVGNVLTSATGSLLYSTVVEREAIILAVPEPRAACMVVVACGLSFFRRLRAAKVVHMRREYECIMSRSVIFTLIVVFTTADNAIAQNQVAVTEQSHVENVGIELLNPNSSFSTLNYQRCDNATNKDKMTLIRINFIGNGPNQVPPGSTIVSATLRLVPIVGGDGIMWRAANPWTPSSTWNSFGGSSLNHFLSPSEGIAMSTEISGNFVVTEEVERWMDGEANQGWVLKGSSLDCTSTRIYSNSSATKFPRLTVTFVPPDTTPPRIRDVFFGSSFSGHPEYVVPVGSGAQLKTIPIGGLNRIYIGFSESIANIDANKFSVTSGNSSTSYPFTVSSTVIGGLPYAVISLTNPLPTDQVIVTAFSTLKDGANNSLDGDWSPQPANVNSTGTDTFQSGNGAAGGNFPFRFTVIHADFNHDNIVNGADEQVQTANYGMASGATHGQGDADGDGDVDGTDFLIWQQQLGTDYTTW